MKENPSNTVVTFILDETGSMEASRYATIDGFNEYITTLKADDTPTLLHLTTFNSSNSRLVYDFEDVSLVKSMTPDDYQPANLTPLYDAIADGIIKTDRYLRQNDEKHDVIFTIMTDGWENCSKRYVLSDIFRMISERERNGWVFNYLGANQDAWLEAGNIGIKRNYASDYDARDPKQAFRTVATSTLRAKRQMKGGIYPGEFFESEQQKKLRRFLET